jgi:hypothetical protein
MATRRSSTSATETIRKHDCGLRNPALNRAAQLSPRSPFQSRSTTEALATRANVPPVQRSGAEDSRVRGPFLGAARPLGLLPPGPLSPRLLAVRASPRPDRPRTPRVAPPGRAAVGVTAMRSERAGEPPTFLSSTRPRHAGRAASRIPSRKEDAFRCTRGAFHQRTPLSEVGLSTGCRQPVE